MTATTAERTLAGYRLVRKLGSGARSEVFLGVSDADGERTVALKVFRPATASDSIASELDALSRANSQHCVRLLDLASGADGRPIAVLGRVQRGSIAGLLNDRDALEPGEAVTLLAPVAGMVDDLHRAGVAHTAISASTIHLGRAGEPVLIGFGHAQLFPPNSSVAALDAEAPVRADRQRLVTLAQHLMSRVRTVGPDIRELLDWLGESGRGHSSHFAVELADRLFDLAEASPVEFGRNDSEGPGRLPGRIGAPVAMLPAEEHAEVAAPTWRRWLHSLLPSLTKVRRPVWVVTGVITVALVAALVLIPDEQSPDAAPPPVPSAAPPESALPHDPVLALPVLLAARDRCFRDLSVLCLDQVDQPDSTALADDQVLVRDILAGTGPAPSTEIAVTEARLVERLGDSALIEATIDGKLASVLLFRGETGWRIRSFLPG